MIRRSARNDPTAGSKKLSDIIDQTKRNEERDNYMESLSKAPTSPQEAFKQPWEGVDSQEAYKRGWEAGEEEGYWKGWDAAKYDS